MPAKIDITGHQYGRLTVVSFNKKSKRGRLWNCLCSCGNKFITLVNNLRSGNTKSCGCLQVEIAVRNLPQKKHGMKGTAYYQKWANMLNRCNNEKHAAYKNYGARGIFVCERWHTFENFYADMGMNPKGLELDRINNDDGYYKENCRWVSRSENIKNQRKRPIDTKTGRFISDQDFKRLGV